MTSFGALAVAADFPQTLATSRFADTLSVHQQVIFDRTEAKQQIVEDVIAGGMKLSNAADKFGELNAKAPESMTAVRLYFTGYSDKESLCREVIYRVKAALEERTAEAEKVIPRLESELQECLGESTPGI
jgi:hypothetical protein